MTKKRLCIFIDGTDNIVENNTSVWRLHALTSVKPDSAGVATLKYYTRGVGTTYGEKLRGSAAGFGTDSIIKDAYQWLIENYVEDDDIFIFGFSRGAFAARGLAGLVAICGVLRPGSPVGVGELFQKYKLGGVRTIFDLFAARSEGRLGGQSTLERWLLGYSTPASITIVGVWDTVGALLFERGTISTGLRKPIKHAFHALAIDEHRAAFAPTLYTINKHLDATSASPTPIRSLDEVEQRWFVGAHANVGGGYNSDLLPQPPLEWLMSKARSLGLCFREELPEADGLYDAAIHDSFREFLFGVYRVYRRGRPFYRKIGSEPISNGNVESSNVNETIDASVFERWRRVPTYRPVNILNWARLKGIDPASLATTVSARDPENKIT